MFDSTKYGDDVGLVEMRRELSFALIPPAPTIPAFQDNHP